MKAMILAAGRGERMRPLTDNCPKPMLTVSGIPLLEHHVRRLRAVGIIDIVINHAWCGDKIVAYFGDGTKFGVNISYSDESSGALETAGGIKKALPLLQREKSSTKVTDNAPFLVVNGDIFTDFDFTELPSLPETIQAHTFLVNNPEHNLAGDFCLSGDLLANKVAADKQVVNLPDHRTFTFSGIALYRPSFFKHGWCAENEANSVEKRALGPMLRMAAEQQTISGSLISQYWADIGTPERLAQINQRVAELSS